MDVCALLRGCVGEWVWVSVCVYQWVQVIGNEYEWVWVGVSVH